MTDAENKQKEVKNASNQTIGLYYFDGDGRRVKKVTTTETVIFVYDAGGKLVAEYSTNLSESPQVQYLTNDHLGTPRINTNENGAVVSRTDYMPYGEEIIGLGGRSTTDKYVTDDVRQGFTGYLNDEETGLDYAQARMYKKELGRFMGVDPVMVGLSKQHTPQELNAYTYCADNPIHYVDPSGAILDPAKWDEKSRKAFEAYEKKLNSNPKKYASEIATLTQLKESDVNYVLRLGSGTDFAAGTEGGLTPDESNNTIFINLANSGNQSEKFSLTSRLGHEFEHARQFDSGEFAFVWDSSGKLIGRADGDISEEVNAWKVQSRLSDAKDKLVKYADSEINEPILGRFESADSDLERAKALSTISEAYGRSYELSKNDPAKFGKNGVPPGTLIRRSTGLKTSNGQTYYGRTSNR